MPQGDIHPCQEIVIGNASKHAFANRWNGSSFLFHRGSQKVLFSDLMIQFLIEPETIELVRGFVSG
jgi:hypothetical protein